MLEAVHESVRDLYEAGSVDTLTMRRLDALSLPPVRKVNAQEIRPIRKPTQMSQAVFAAVLNVGSATVAAWERDGKEPTSAALKLLDLIEQKGIETQV
jgi:putative transcriptional regulator